MCLKYSAVFLSGAVLRGFRDGLPSEMGSLHPLSIPFILITRRYSRQIRKVSVFYLTLFVLNVLCNYADIYRISSKQNIIRVGTGQDIRT